MNHYRGGQGILYIYIYILYVHKLKALILSIVFNYQHFLMKIDCTKCFFILCLCMLLPEQMNFMDGTPVTAVALHPPVFKRKRNLRYCCSYCLLPIMNAQIKHL